MAVEQLCWLFVMNSAGWRSKNGELNHAPFSEWMDCWMVLVQRDLPSRFPAVRELDACGLRGALAGEAAALGSKIQEGFVTKVGDRLLVRLEHGQDLRSDVMPGGINFRQMASVGRLVQRWRSRPTNEADSEDWVTSESGN